MPQNARPVSELMTREVVTVEANEPLSLADDIMQLGRIRHMPVVDEEGELVGVLSQRDLFRGALAATLGFGRRAQSRMLESIRAKEVMRGDVQTIAPDATLAEAAKLMLTKKIGCLVVMEGGQIAGILTEADFVKAIAES